LKKSYVPDSTRLDPNHSLKSEEEKSYVPDSTRLDTSPCLKSEEEEGKYTKA
jgi:hypothetical protein